MRSAIGKPAVADTDSEEPAYVRDYRERGYAIVRGVFAVDEVAELAAAFDRIWSEGLAHPRSFRHGNVFWRIADDPVVGRLVRYMQWPSYFDTVLDRFRCDPRMGEIVRPLIGADLKQIINQMHWKPRGAAAEFGFHQDIRFRRPRSAYRNPAGAYVQTGIAVDAHTAGSGAMLVYPGSHRLGELVATASAGASVMDTPMDVTDLVRLGLDPHAVEGVELAPGDVALWHLYTLHGSGPNRTAADRRFYLNGYVRAADCDRGEWTFRDGRAVRLGAPVMVHYEDLHERPEPHYVGD
ncbi:MAG: phytanoyl-CoA dioxygenase family protein [Rhodospirillales bacterium]